MLKKFRIVFSLLTLLLFAVIFIAGGVFARYLSRVLPIIQFIPSVLSIFLFGIIFLTLVSSRTYCSFLCPLGVFQDIVIFFRRIFKLRFSYSKANTFIQYIFFGIVIISIGAGSFILLSVTEPFSVIGRFFNSLIKPFFVIVAELGIDILRFFGVYVNFNPVTYSPPTAVIVLPLITILTIMALAFLKGRLFCNLICPVGTFLGILSRFSLFGVKFEKSACISCMACSRVCKARCIDGKDKQIDVSRCVTCFNCINVCKSDALHYKIRIKGEVEEGRRNFITNAGHGMFALLFLGSFPFRDLMNSSRKIKMQKLITPPGSGGVTGILKKCTGCHLCVSSCPTKVLQPVTRGYEMTGIMQVAMNYNDAFCDYECTVCSEVCPTGAIKDLKLEEKKLTQIGQVELYMGKCIVYRNHKECGACSEHCPTKAVFMVPFGGLYGPEINPEICVGCGACEFICPAQPVKAIKVASNIIHKRALPPLKVIPDSSESRKVDVDDEFPF